MCQNRMKMARKQWIHCILEIKKGEFFVLIGPSGCGKTTTMKMINRLIETTEGSILIDGKRYSTI